MLQLLLLFLVACKAQPQYFYAPYAANYGYAIPDGQNSQFHAQDSYGQFRYGYATPTSSKEEQQTADGVVQGAYSYVDANNIVQTVQYVADAYGFRVAATNLPVGPVAPAAEVQAVAAPPAVSYVTPQVPYYAPNYVYNYVPAQPTYSVPVVSAPVAPVAVIASKTGDNDDALDIRTGGDADIAPAVVPIQSLYHSQDEAGTYEFGYTDPNSSRQETKDVNGVVSGSYNYVDINGNPQTVTYIADVNGYRASASNLPVYELVAPEPVEDTPEVVAAREAHLQLVEEEKQRQAEAAVYVAPELPAETPSIVEVSAEAAPEAAQVYAVPASVPAYNTVPVYYAPTYAYQQAPVAYAPTYAYQQAPLAYAPAYTYQQAPVAIHASQHHAQDDLGQYNYGYSNENSAKQEFRTADGVVQGTYSYVDGNGIVQTVTYVSDEGGFRVAATNLPVGPVPAPATPVESGPVESGPVESGPVEPVEEAIQEDADMTLDIRSGALA